MIFPPAFAKEKGPTKIRRKSPAKFIWESVRKFLQRPFLDNFENCCGMRNFLKNPRFPTMNIEQKLLVVSCRRGLGSHTWQNFGIIERGVPQAYVRARASSAALCSVHVLRVFSLFSISNRESDTYQNGLGYISDTYPNPYPLVTVPPL